MADFDAHRIMALALVGAFLVIFAGAVIGLAIEILTGMKR